MRKPGECRCFAPLADDSSDDNDDGSSFLTPPPTRPSDRYRAWSLDRPVPTDQKVRVRIPSGAHSSEALSGMGAARLRIPLGDRQPGGWAGDRSTSSASP